MSPSYITNQWNPVAIICEYMDLLVWFVNSAVKEILKLCATETFVSLYKIQNFDSAEDFLQKVAIVRGKLKKGGIVDVEAAARIVLHDWNEGIHTSPRVGYIFAVSQKFKWLIRLTY